MSNGPRDSNEAHGSDQQQPVHDQGDQGSSGEGSASAMAHMISRGLQQRHQTGEADDAAGSRHQ